MAMNAFSAVNGATVSSGCQKILSFALENASMQMYNLQLTHLIFILIGIDNCPYTENSDTIDVELPLNYEADANDFTVTQEERQRKGDEQEGVTQYDKKGAHSGDGMDELRSKTQAASIIQHCTR
jgi:hypothetical protein